MAVQYAPLFALETQFQAKNGRNLTGGFLRVFYAATDDPADTYSDYNLTRNPDRIVLDDNGRALVICDKSKAYRLEVYDAEGMLLWTEEPVYCSGTGGGGVSITRVISTDGSIAIDESVAGSTTTYDIGLAPRDNDEFLEWIKCSEEDCGSTWYPVYQEGTMETEAGQGIKVHKGQLYHFTNSFTVDPNGSGINYDTFRVTMYCGDDVVDERDFDIDSSLNDPVLCEFSRDVVPAEDGHVYFKLTIPATCEVAGEVQCHRIYSGINAVPDTCATKQWIAESYQPLSGMSSYVPYSAVGNNSIGQVTGINGSAIVGSLDSAMVSSIASSVASSYTESAFSSISSWTAEFSSISSKADSSSLSAYQPVSAMSGYATEAYVDAKVGEKLDATASSLFLTGLPDDLATTGDVASAVSGKLDKSASGEFYPMTGNPSGFLTAHQSLAGLATVEYVDSSVSSKLDTSAFASASAGFQPSGNYAYSSSLSAYYPASASGAFQPSGQYQTAGDYALNSAVSAKLDASASSDFVVNSAMTSWIPYSALDYSGTAISGIGGSSLAGMGGGGGDYTGIYPVNVDNTAREISVDSLPLVTDSSMTAYGSAGSSVIGVNMGILSGKQDTLSFSYDDDKISAINGSALAGQGGATGDYVEKSALDVGIGSGNYSLNTSFTQGELNTAKRHSFAQGFSNSASGTSFAQGRTNTSLFYSFAQGSSNSASSYSFAQGWANSASYHSFAQGFNNSAINTVAVFGEYNLHGDGSTSTGNSAAFAIGDGTDATARHDLMLVTKDGEITMYSSTADTSGTGIMSSIRAISAAATGGVDSATVSAIASSYQVVSATGTQLYAGTTYVTSVNEAPISADRAGRAGNATLATSAYYDTNARFISALPDSAAVSAIASAYAESAASGKQDTLAFAYNTADQISSINGSALGGMDEAAVSGIASAYAESAASGCIPTSMSSDFQQVTGMSSYALSSDVSATVDLVGTQSANWGGSALALSAGPGVKLEKVGNTLVASTDETVLWSASGYTVGDSSQSITLSESPLNFNTIRVYGYRPLPTSSPCGLFSEDIDIQWLNAASVKEVSFPYTIRATTTQYAGSFELSGITSTTWVEGGWHCGLASTASVATSGVYAHLHKVIGINRTAGV